MKVILNYYVSFSMLYVQQVHTHSCCNIQVGFQRTINMKYDTQKEGKQVIHTTRERKKKRKMVRARARERKRGSDRMRRKWRLFMSQKEGKIESCK